LAPLTLEEPIIIQDISGYWLPLLKGSQLLFKVSQFIGSPNFRGANFETRFLNLLAPLTLGEPIIIQGFSITGSPNF
jgi:hypothetical protein